MEIKGLNQNDILNIYLRGSHLFGTAHEDSDYDYIVVVENFVDVPLTIDYDNKSFAVVHKETWDKLARKNQIEFFEAIFAPKDCKIKETYVPNFEFNYEFIRRNFSQQASNSWVKCKKKLTVEKDYSPYIGRKSMWHSLRILMEGIQLIKNGKIIDFEEANDYYEDIVMTNKTWEELKEKYQQVYNKLKSEFRKIYEVK